MNYFLMGLEICLGFIVGIFLILCSISILGYFYVLIYEYFERKRSERLHKKYGVK